MTKKKKICLLVGVLLLIAGLGLFGFTVVQGATGFHSKFVSIGIDDDGELGLLNIHDGTKVAVNTNGEYGNVEERVDNIVSEVYDLMGTQEFWDYAFQSGQSNYSNQSSTQGNNAGVVDTSALGVTAESVHKLQLDLQNVEVKVSYNKEFLVKTSRVDKDLINVTLENGVLTVSGGLSDGSNTDDREVDIYLPLGTKLTSVIGEMDTGEIELEHVNADLAQISVKTGKISIDESNVPTVQLECDTGEIDLSGSFSDADAKVITGTVDFEGTADQLNLECVTGKVDAELKSSNCRVDAKCDSGQIEIAGQKFNGSATWGDASAASVVEISVGTGEIEVEFDR